MKFGKLLQSKMCADEMMNLGIGEHFLRYKALKKQLKALSGADAHRDMRIAVVLHSRSLSRSVTQVLDSLDLLLPRRRCWGCCWAVGSRRRGRRA